MTYELMETDMIKKKSFAVSMLLAAAVLASTGTTVRGGTEDSEVSTYTKTDFAMDTVVSETLYTTGEDITADVIQALKDIEDNLISWTKESSQIYQINQKAGSTVTVSDETAGYLKQVLALSKASDGAMDRSDKYKFPVPVFLSAETAEHKLPVRKEYFPLRQAEPEPLYHHHNKFYVRIRSKILNTYKLTHKIQKRTHKTCLPEIHRKILSTIHSFFPASVPWKHRGSKAGLV